MWREIVHNMESNSKESNLYACDNNASFHKAWGDTRIDFCLTKGAELGLRKAQKETEGKGAGWSILTSDIGMYPGKFFINMNCN